MDYDKLIERLKCPHIHRCPMYDEYPSCKACQKSIQQEAALAIETLRAELTRVTAERDAAVKDLNEFLAMDELCPIQCEWCKWNGTYCDGKTPEWRGIKED